ncbi:DUF3012 domain-containing protein [Marinobacterium rhizophilum]|uniref:DUF3012 domain-containing protein n=1 Tax=Marinobacterium rhizophilum TaxID=420402 RepID=A0ABY5HP81_9GAMM|nr:DUF3012 domain-containing protein [Marinobacterium rhizophilum]UTW13037.1 DUF3012 domain-containing protein [Marinobacterium rhizophilum]
MSSLFATPTLVAVALGSLLLIQGCSPQVGSDAWCTQMEEKPKGEWTVNDAGEFAKSCILK